MDPEPDPEPDLDPDPHQLEKWDPDPVPHQNVLDPLHWSTVHGMNLILEQHFLFNIFQQANVHLFLFNIFQQANVHLFREQS